MDPITSTATSDTAIIAEHHVILSKNFQTRKHSPGSATQLTSSLSANNQEDFANSARTYLSSGPPSPSDTVPAYIKELEERARLDREKAYSSAEQSARSRLDKDAAQRTVCILIIEFSL